MKKLIGITGYAGAGKSTLASAIHLQCCRDGVGCKVFHIADHLKARFCEATGMSRELMEERKRTHPLIRYYLQVTGDWLKEHGEHPCKSLSDFLYNARNSNDVIIIPDVRFPEEVELIRLKGGKIVNISRPGFKGCNNHPSESSVDNVICDYRVDNNQTTKWIETEAKNILALL